MLRLVEDPLMLKRFVVDVSTKLKTFLELCDLGFGRVETVFEGFTHSTKECLYEKDITV